ncbi:MAG: PfkB family carbohydrate kinase [Methylococcales bacterium]
MLVNASEQSNLKQYVDLIKSKSNNSSRIAFVSGCFDIIHPGHLRLLNFAAECSDFLVVGLFPDNHNGTYLSGELRLENMQAISYVDYAVVLPVSVEKFIETLQPNTVVKGKEHEGNFNSEKSILDGYGGKLLFSSGDVRFSSINLLQRELYDLNFSAIKKSEDYPVRHQFDFSTLIDYIQKFRSLRVTVIGDLIVDEYISCDPLGMSQEDPTIVVTPIKSDLFVGGAGIVAAHSCGLGAQVNYIGVCGDDEQNIFAKKKLLNYGVLADIIIDESRPTTLKQRFRTQGKTLLRVSHLRQHDISQELIIKIFEKFSSVIEKTDLLIFSDFNYGCLPQKLVDMIAEKCKSKGVMMVADSQASSQSSDISRYKEMTLVTPTEREARLATKDSTSGLVALAESLQKKCNSKHVLITLGEEGVFIHAPSSTSKLITDQLPAFNTLPKDVAGGGDSFLTCSSMALAVGANIWEAAYLGSIASACQVGRVGNLPLSASELIQELNL